MRSSQAQIITAAGLALSLLAQPAPGAAGAPLTAPRPEPRPETRPETRAEGGGAAGVSGVTATAAATGQGNALAAAALAARGGSALAPASTPRPGRRPQGLGAASAARAATATLTAEDRATATAAAPIVAASAPVADPAGQRALEAWVRGFRSRALSQGISAATFDRAMRDVRYLPDVIRRDRSQAEFTRPIWEYLASAVSETRVANGRAALARHRPVLEQISRRYGVEPEVIVAIWGIETNYGSNRGSTRILDAMATLAKDGRRARFFEEQLVAALRIVQAGDIAPERMIGSWAGAMGHTQFMPTSYLAYAQDFTGNGRRDIWSDDPTDALASAANYLARFGWRRGQPWGMEVVLPRGFDYSRTGRQTTLSPAQWNAMGVRLASGGPIPDHGRASILLPAGARGAAFVTFDNFGVIRRYNPADAYVIAVGHLADRIAGGGPLRASWPTGDRNLNAAERREMQERLTRRGFDTRGVDGIVGPNTIAAVRRFQASVGMVPDGYASYEVLRRLR